MAVTCRAGATVTMTVVAMVAIAGDASARRVARPRSTAASPVPRQAYPPAPRRMSPYSVGQGQSGTITASTPNQDGNLGGPGGGGGGGGK